MRALRTRLTSLLNRRGYASEPADGWFTLQPEPGHREVSESVTITALRDEAVDQKPGAGARVIRRSQGDDLEVDNRGSYGALIPWDAARSLRSISAISGLARRRRRRAP